jgi:hypothetical protein
MEILRTVMLSICWVAIAFAGTPRFGSSFRINYTWKDDFFDRELEVYVGPDAKGNARLTYSGDSRGKPWDSTPIKSACQLDARLIGELRTLLDQADVYGDQHWGFDRRGQDIALRTILFTSDGGTVAAVVSGNKSYQSGVRCKLVSTLNALSTRMSASPPPKECSYESLNVQPTCSSL